MRFEQKWGTLVEQKFLEKWMSTDENSSIPLKMVEGEGMGPFSIVGIGASAGGLEALELFIGQIPLDSGLAYVIVQNQDPTHKSIMVELLQHHTKLPIFLIEDQMQVAVNSIYFIPPGLDLTIRNDFLYLQEPTVARGLRLPIDIFFTSLAEDKQHFAVGVILSGMGSDGTFGLRAIKENGGAIFVQEPSTARFDAMPRSAIKAGWVDVVAPVLELPIRIINYLRHLPSPFDDKKLEEPDQNAIQKIVSLINTETGHDFSLYKKNTVYRRIERRMGLYQLSSINDYVHYLVEHKQEIGLLFKELLIGVTRFFRDTAVWEQFKNEIFPALFAQHSEGRALRAWVAGCSTGEEAYSLAIIFKEALEALRPTHKKFSLQIFASDLDKDTIAKARTGLFSYNIAADVSEARLRRHFSEDESGYRINKEIREMVIFASHNIIMDPPFTKLDILTCRNLLIYLDSELQKKLLLLFHYSLNSNGILMLGSAETIGNASYLFASFPGKTRLFRRLESATRALGHEEFPSSNTRNISELSIPTPPMIKPNSPPANLKTLVENLLLSLYSPPAVLVTDQGDILYISGKTGKYLEPATGKANLNLFAMAREGLKQAFSETFQKALRLQSPVVMKSVKVMVNGNLQGVDLTVHPMVEREEFSGLLLVIFHEVDLPIYKSSDQHY